MRYLFVLLVLAGCAAVGPDAAAIATGSDLIQGAERNDTRK